MKARFIHLVGTRATLRVLWGSAGFTPSHTVPCPKSCDGKGAHAAEAPLADSSEPGDDQVGGELADVAPERWPTRCDACGDVAPAEAHRYIMQRRLYDTASGSPEPGDLFLADCWQRYGPGQTCAYWDNCPGQHLYAVLPNGHHWDVDSRASNCTLPQDRAHRCWVRHGDPPAVHVDKEGHTCAAGAGSIAVPGYHGFLHHGAFTSC